MSKTKTVTRDNSNLILGGLIATLVVLGGGMFYSIFASQAAEDEARKNAQQTLTEQFNLNRIELPEQVYTLEPGLYEITVPTRTGARECLISVSSSYDFSFQCQ